MINKQHGHIVLEFLAARHGKPVSREELDAHLEANYGNDIRFNVCAGDNMSLDELLDFLLERKKIKISEGKISFNSDSEICHHE